MKKVLAISSVLLGVVFLAGCGQQTVSQAQPKTPAPVAQTPTQPVATQPAPAETQPAQGVVYLNTQYGFQLTLPRGWESYKAVFSKQTGVNRLGIISIDMPTSDKTFLGYPDSTGKSLAGYSSMFLVQIYDTKGYNAEVARCKKENDPDCNVTLPGNAIQKEGNNYVFAISMPQALPADLQKIEMGADVIKNSFKFTK